MFRTFPQNFCKVVDPEGEVSLTVESLPSFSIPLLSSAGLQRPLAQPAYSTPRAYGDFMFVFK